MGTARLTAKLLSGLLLSLLVGCATLMAPDEVDPDDDNSIERAVRAEVRRAPVRGAGTVDVVVEDGVVTLTGDVPEPAAVGEIVLRAEKVKGVRRVITEIEFDGSEEQQRRAPPEAGR